MPRVSGVGLLAAILLIGSAGCADSQPSPGAGGPQSSSPSSPSASAVAWRALAAVQAELAARTTIRVRTSTAGAQDAGASEATADLLSGDFRAELDLGSGKGTLRMLRVADTAWTKAPAAVWVGFGYTPASARRAEGKWVVARVDSIEALVGALDPVAIVRGIADLDQADVVDLRPVRSGALRGMEALRVRVGPATRTLFLSAGARPGLQRIRVLAGGVTTDVALLSAPARVRVPVPAAAEVLQR
jgi:hypothetical protein